MKTLKLDHYFTKIIGGDLVKKPKPAPDMVNLALECVNCDSDRVIVIGDHPFDILMGESANSGLNLGVLTGLSNSTMFDNLNCVVIDDLTKIDLEH